MMQAAQVELKMLELHYRNFLNVAFARVPFVFSSSPHGLPQGLIEDVLHP